MKERPILMNGDMVRATLREIDPKRQTRRVMNPQPYQSEYEPETFHVSYTTKKRRTITGKTKNPETGLWEESSHVQKKGTLISAQVTIDWYLDKCPYGKIGDRLWIRETFLYTSAEYLDGSECEAFLYRATSDVEEGPWTPSLFMPRRASRILLEITSIRVERLQDISEEDAMAEGIRRLEQPGRLYFMWSPKSLFWDTARLAFIELWNKINRKKHPWESNPLVWVIEFKRIKP